MKLHEALVTIFYSSRGHSCFKDAVELKYISIALTFIINQEHHLEESKNTKCFIKPNFPIRSKKAVFIIFISLFPILPSSKIPSAPLPPLLLETNREAIGCVECMWNMSLESFATWKKLRGRDCNGNVYQLAASVASLTSTTLFFFFAF